MARWSMTVAFGLVGVLPVRAPAGFADVDVSPTHRVTTQPASAQAPEAARAGARGCGALIQALRAAVSPVAKVERGLAAARCAIVLECAAPLSRDLNGVAAEPGAFSSVVATGEDCLHVAVEAMQHLPNGFDENRRRILQDRIDMLRAFADVFAALAASDGSDRASARLTDACVGLAVFVDDPNRGVAESAKLWQAVAYRRAGRADRTLNLLRPIIGSLRSSRVDFFTRMERCRALVDAGRFVAAQSLAMRLEKRVNLWLVKENETTRKRAADSLRRFRAECYKRWAADLRKRGKEDRAKATEDEMRRVLGDASLEPAIEDILLLDQTIAGLPDWEPPESTPATQAAGTPKK